MNIFVLDENPLLAAQFHCDKHTVKMVLESGQMLATAHHVLDKSQLDLPKATHINHPCNVWVRKSNANYQWLYDHFCALLGEYTYRYNKIHAWDTLKNTLQNSPKNILETNLTKHPLCMPDEYKIGDVVKSYREYYLKDKVRFAKWNKARSAPDWWRNEINYSN